MKRAARSTTLVTACVTVLLAACGVHSEERGEAELGSAPPPPYSAPLPVAREVPAGFDLSLATGDTWRFRWSVEEEVTTSRSGSHTEARAGELVLTLGVPVPVEGVSLFTLEVEGAASLPELAPRWSHLGNDGGRLVGSRDGQRLETIFDPTGDLWVGGGLFAADWVGVEVRARVAAEALELLTPGALSCGFELVDDARAFHPSIGPIEGGSHRYDEHEYYEPDLGPVAYRSALTSHDAVGSTYWVRREITLVESSRAGPNSDVWRLAAALAAARDDGYTAVAFDGQLVRFGAGVPLESGQRLDDVAIFDPLGADWRPRAMMPAVDGVLPRELRAAAVFGPLLPSGGGVAVVGFAGERPVALFYEPDADRWSVFEAPPAELAPDGALRGGDALLWWESREALWSWDVEGGLWTLEWSAPEGLTLSTLTGS